MMKKLFCMTALAGLLAAPALAQEWDELPLGEHTWIEGSGEYREGEYEIPVAAGSALEYAVALDEGQTIVYAWTAEGDASSLQIEFHGHTDAGPGETGKLMFYRVHSGDRESGALIAPFSGNHGWYLQNDGDEDLVITLKVAGFYREIPDQL